MASNWFAPLGGGIAIDAVCPTTPPAEPGANGKITRRTGFGVRARTVPPGGQETSPLTPLPGGEGDKTAIGTELLRVQPHACYERVGILVLDPYAELCRRAEPSAACGFAEEFIGMPRLGI